MVEAVRCALGVASGLSERNADLPADRRIERAPASISATSSRSRTAAFGPAAVAPPSLAVVLDPVPTPPGLAAAGPNVLVPPPTLRYAATPLTIVSITCRLARSKAASSSGRPPFSVAISCAALAYCWVVAQIM